MRPSNDVYWHTPRSSKGIAFARSKPSSLKENIRAEIVVVGGGMAGLTVAQQLAEAGKEVVLLEKDFCGSGASGKSSGFITPDSELELGSLTGRHGPKKAKRLWEFVIGGVELIRKNIETCAIECDYRVQDSLFIANSPAAFRKKVKSEHEARQELGYSSTLYARAELGGVIGSANYHGAVRYPDTFGMNGYAYCQGMKEQLAAKGVKIYEHSPAVHIHADGAEANGFRVTAPVVVLAADHAIPQLGTLKRDIYHAQTFLGISKPLAPETTQRLFPEKELMVWDTDFIYQYFRPAMGNRLLIGGADVRFTYARKATIPPPQNILRKLTQYLAQKFPDATIPLDYLWPGLIGISKDFLPIAGQDKEQKNLYYIGAAAGLPWAAALGNYIAEKILHGRSDFDADFTCERRFPIPSPAEKLLPTPAAFAISNGISKLH